MNRHLSPEIWEELQNVFQAVITVVNSVKNSPLEDDFAKFCDDMEAEHMAVLYYCEIYWLSRAKVFQRVFELKEETLIFLIHNNNNGDVNLLQLRFGLLHRHFLDN